MKETKIEMIEKKFLTYHGLKYEVTGVFSHKDRNYITIDVKDEHGKPHTICDKNDTLYNKIEKVKVPKNN